MSDHGLKRIPPPTQIRIPTVIVVCYSNSLAMNIRISIQQRLQSKEHDDLYEGIVKWKITVGQVLQAAWDSPLILLAN